jgi:hypothetical protein
MTEMRLLSLLLCLNLCACATTYSGGTPDWSASGDETEHEVEDFTVKAGFWGNTYEMGGKTYYMGSMQPLFNNVSVEGAKSLRRARLYNEAALVALGASLAVLFLQGSDVRTADHLAFWTFLGIGVGFSVARHYAREDAAESYNRDLRSKFNPSVSMAFDF